MATWFPFVVRPITVPSRLTLGRPLPTRLQADPWVNNGFSVAEKFVPGN